MKRLELTLKALSPELIVFFVYVIAFAVMQYVTRPIQDALIAPTLVGTLVFLPHGVRVIGVWLFGYRSILPLLLGEVFGMYFLATFQLPLGVILQGAVVGGVSCFIAFEVFRLAGQNLYFEDGTRTVTWRMLILLGGVGSVFNSIGHIVVYRAAFSFDDDIEQVLGFLLGDLGGTVVLLLAMVFVNRSFRQLKI